MIDEQLEFRLTQYLDGTLPPEEAPALFDELAKNREAWVVLDEYRKLDVLMAAKPAAVRWDALAEHISGHIDEDQQSRMKIRVFTAPMRAAIAAGVLLAFGVAAWLTIPTPPLGETPGGGSVAKVSNIQGPAVEVAAGAAVAEIAIGPAPTYAESDDNDWLAESRPQRAILFSGVAVDRQEDRPF